MYKRISITGKTDIVVASTIANWKLIPTIEVCNHDMNLCISIYVLCFSISFVYRKFPF